MIAIEGGRGPWPSREELERRGLDEADYLPWGGQRAVVEAEYKAPLREAGAHVSATATEGGGGSTGTRLPLREAASPREHD